MVAQNDNKRGFWNKFQWLDRSVTFISFALNISTGWKQLLGLVSISSFTAYALLPWAYAVIIPATVLLICSCVSAHKRLINKDNLDFIATEKMRERVEADIKKAAERRNAKLKRIQYTLNSLSINIPTTGRIPCNLEQDLYELQERLRVFGVPCPEPYLQNAARWTLFITLLRTHLETGDFDSAKAILDRVDDIASKTDPILGEVPF